MLSRIADSLFWMSRYMERTDGMLRMLKINSITGLDQSGQSDFSWLPVVRMFTDLPPEEAARLAGNGNEVLRYIVFRRENENSIRSVVARARENARGAQDHITKEVWESINELYLQLNDPDLENALERGDQIVMLSNLIQQYLGFCGTAEVTMPRGQGWNYLNLGRYMERGILTAHFLDLKFDNLDRALHSIGDLPYWRSLLLSLSGYELFLKAYQTIGGLESKNVAHMAILNPHFPKSLAYCVFRVERTLHNLAADHPETSTAVKLQAGRLRSKLEFTDIDMIYKVGLHEFLTEIKKDFYDLSNTLGRIYFAYN